MMIDDNWLFKAPGDRAPQSIATLIKPEDVIRIGVSNTDMISKKAASEIVEFIHASFLRNFRAIATLYSHKDCDDEVYWTSTRDEKHSEYELTMYDVKKLQLPKVNVDEILKCLETIGAESQYAKSLADRIKSSGVVSTKPI